MIGTACPSLSTSRSALGFHGSFGSHRIWWYIRTATRWASDRAVDGWPLPAAVVISTDSLPMSTAFLLAACSKLMVTPAGAGDRTCVALRRPPLADRPAQDFSGRAGNFAIGPIG